MSDIRSSSLKLYNFGFALHWLRNNSKIPIESKWSSGKRKDWRELSSSYVKGYNLGIRLGEASKIVDTLGVEDVSYLAVIDCDVKSTESKHIREMNKKLKELFGDKLDNTSIVMSGRGNGSCHYYIRTSTPIKPIRLSQSNDKVKVHMPSVQKFSKFEEKTLTAKELENGMRLRPAWEISLMGTGQQVACPPSIHPDSKKSYVWKKEIKDIFNDVVLIGEFNKLTKGDKDNENSESDKNNEISNIDNIIFNNVDLYSTILSDQAIDLIVKGKGCEGDRSSSLFIAIKEMVKCQMTDSEILSILTNKEYYLGDVAYDHTKSNNRLTAAKWLKRFTLSKVRKEFDLKKIFEKECKTSILSDKDSIQQCVDLTTVKDWRNKIERSYSNQDVIGKPKNTLKNIELILENGIDDIKEGESVFKRDDFAGVDLYGVDTPWGGKKNKEIRDIDILNIKGWFFNKWRVEPSNDKLNEAVSRIADKNKYHPVKEYLESLPKWDGKKRLDTWLKRLLGAKAPEPYLSDISRKTIVAMIARVYQPGVKFDQVLILQGPQGIGKSTAIRHLAGDAWFSDAHIDITDKDSVLSLRNIWAFELGELSGMRKADIDMLKEFISRKEDRIRLPYGRRSENFPRQNIFIGTTNQDEFLKDATGNRRFWPIEVTNYDFESILNERDQLFAEALVYYACGESLYLDDKLSQQLAIEEQDLRFEDLPFMEILSNFFNTNSSENFPKNRFSMSQLFEPFGPLEKFKFDKSNQMQASTSLRKLGFQRISTTSENRRKTKLWIF